MEIEICIHAKTCVVLNVQIGICMDYKGLDVCSIGHQILHEV